ncbi:MULTISPECIES: sugar transferase [Priestia]|uniref:sugar transferase n=1 Tax=Priestia TaxID=2800373 RepID=UPI001C8D49B6|nr:sugar transferase [Priestia aryabhattai]MBY0213507.1 sugar transferase [Priestia aryabhattai]MDT0148381.1 sugar transferase [Priestia aryabhattai]MDT0153753.1 sugar transferase [Priestia aryabhattai]
MPQVIAKDASDKLNAPQIVADIPVSQRSSYLFLKRTFDIMGALLGIIFLSLVFFIVAVIIKLEDPKGPIFFSQKRIGKNGQEFHMYKFRSMVTDAEERLQELLKLNETTGAMFKMKNDPRVTKIGRFIRKTSIDELPQLWNVLKGDMTLVGPRPPLQREVAEYTGYQLQRLLVTPGCTGLWQVSGRSNIGFEEMVELDLSYIQSRTFFMDIKIIFKTVAMVFGSKGAY